jgi:hypothetical protein
MGSQPEVRADLRGRYGRLGGAMQVAVRPLAVVGHVVGPVPDDTDAMPLLRINAEHDPHTVARRLQCPVARPLPRQRPGVGLRHEDLCAGPLDDPAHNGICPRHLSRSRSREYQIGSRAFAPLRRDERKAWDRAPGAREAYIAPALKPDGSANPCWITRSDWPLERRIVATPRTERLFDLYKIYVLAGRPGSAEASYRGPRTPVDALLEKYAQDILDTEPPPASASDEEFRAWRAQVRERVGIAIGENRREDEPDRKQIARQLADLPDRERIWGRDATIETGGRGNKRS